MKLQYHTKNLYNAPEDKTKYASVYDKYKLFYLK